MIALALFALPALAQDIPVPAVDAQLYHLPVDATSTAWAADSHLASGFSARLGVGFMKQPFVWVWDDTQERVAVVDDVLGVDAIASYSVWRLRAAVDVPLYALATGAVETGGGLGDIGIDVKGVVLDRETAPLGLALTGRVGLPTSTAAVPLGEDGVGWEIAAVVDKRFGNLVAVANVGTRGVPDVALANVSVSDAFTWRVGAGYGLGESAGVSVDLGGQFAYADPGNVASTTAEAMVGGWYRVAEPLTLRGAVGRGLTRGIGAPAGRVVLALAWEPGNGKAAKAETAKVATATAKPTKPETAKAETAKPTSTAKAAATAKPAATAPPVRAPAKQDFLVVPGTSTLPPGIVHIKVTDPTGAPIDARWAFGSVASGPIAHGLGMAKVAPGPWSVLVSAEGYGTVALSVDVDTGMTTSLTAALAPARVRLTAEKIELLEKVRFNGTVLDAPSQALFDEVAATLRAHPEITGIRVEGHTDSRGLAEDNLSLSGARAAAVLAYLVEQGLDPNRFMAAGYGEARPVDLAETPAAWERNQRIELVITERRP